MDFKIIVFVASIFTVGIASHADQPNIVVFMADDIGLGDLGHYARAAGAKVLVETPNIDRLIAEGVSFSDAHSPASLCAPSRFSMMTGNYSYRNSRPWGVWGPADDPLIDPDFTTVARLAKAGGYRTAFLGKWGLGGSWMRVHDADYSKEAEGPLSYGFDYAMTLPQGIQSFPYAFYENREWVRLKPESTFTRVSHQQAGYGLLDSRGKKKKTRRRDYSGVGDSNWDPALAGPMLVSRAVSYIENHVKNTPDDVFYMYYCSQAVHVPHTPPAELDGVKIAGSTGGAYGDMVLELDTQVGMIVKALKKEGLYQDTLFIFTSDNGGLSAIRGHDSSLNLSGKKGSIAEGGHRVPFIAVWPGKIRPGVISDEPIVGLDIVATVATLAGQTIDREVVMDSANLLPLFLGKQERAVHKYLVHRSKGGPYFAIREGKWKLIMKAENMDNMDGLRPFALFNLEDNASENAADNLLNNPEYNERVRSLFQAFRHLTESGEATVLYQGFTS